MMSVFKEDGWKYFDISYLPKKMPHREKEKNEIVDIFKLGLDKNVFKIPVIYGPSGTGKTTVIHKVFKELKELYDGLIETYVLNSLTAAKTYVAITRIASHLIPIPHRGLSQDEIIDRLYNVLKMRDQRYLVALDDSDDLIRRDGGKIIELLTRIEEEYGERLIYPIIIVRNMAPIYSLSDHIKSKIDGPKIEFRPYNWRELIDIIEERIELGLKEDAISENAVKVSAYISDEIFNGSAREMINLIYNSGLVADRENNSRIIAEHVRKAFYMSYSRNIAPAISDMEINILKAIAKRLSADLDKIEITKEDITYIYEYFRDRGSRRIELKQFIHILDEELYLKKKLLYKDESGRYIFFYYPVTHILNIV
ncbi:MAG TPA: AAA family ATPase [Thermoprotei archaeon]|nr:AAA family ATPase [Thermoprotei archaeon]